MNQLQNDIIEVNLLNKRKIQLLWITNSSTLLQESDSIVINDVSKGLFSIIKEEIFVNDLDPISKYVKFI